MSKRCVFRLKSVRVWRLRQRIIENDEEFPARHGIPAKAWMVWPVHTKFGGGTSSGSRRERFLSGHTLQTVHSLPLSLTVLHTARPNTCLPDLRNRLSDLEGHRKFWAWPAQSGGRGAPKAFPTEDCRDACLSRTHSYKSQHTSARMEPLFMFKAPSQYYPFGHTHCQDM